MQNKKLAFPNPTINFNGFDEVDIKNFSHVADYLELVSPYIYTSVKHTQTIERDRLLSWILRSLSENLLRSIYIRNLFVECINSGNSAGLYLPLKAWAEIAGAIASLLDLLNPDMSDEELLRRLQPYVLGNKGKGEYRVGDVDSINVLTMLKKADKYLKSLADEVNTEEISSYYENFYDVASNPSHPNFDASQTVGRLVSGTGIWEAFLPSEYKNKVCDISGYRGLLLTSLLIPHICEEIFCKEGETFIKLGEPYFAE